VTWPGSGQPRNHGSIPDWAEIIFISKTWKLALRPTQPHSLVTGVRSWWWYSNWFRKLTAHLHQNVQVLNEQKNYNTSFNLFFPLWCNNPTRAQAASLFRFRDLQSLDTPHEVELLWTRDRSVAETSTWQNLTSIRDRHACPCGIRTRNPSKRPTADLCSKTAGPLGLTHFHIIYVIYYYL